MSMKVAQNSAASKKKKKTTSKPATQAIREKVQSTAAAAQTANAVQQSRKVQQLDPQMAGALYGAAQKAAADNYNAAVAQMQPYWQNGSGVMAYGELPGYQVALKNYQNALLATVSTGLQQFTGPRGQARFQNQMSGLNGEMQRVNNMLGMSEADYNQNVYWPEKYRGSDAASVNTAMARLRFDGDAGQDELAWLRQHQYDYWTTDQLDRGIEATQGSYDRQRDRNVNSAFLQSQIDAMRAARENNAYRETMSGWSEQDSEMMETLARLSDRKTNVQNTGTAAQAMTPGVNNPFLALTTSQEANANDPEIQRLTQYFRDKGYTDAQIASMVDYFIRNQHAQDRQREMQQLADWANTNVGTQIAGSLLSVPMNLTSGLGYVDLAIQNATAGQDAITGQRKHIDQYSPMTAIGDASSTIRGAVSSKLNPFWSFMYQTGMSMLDSGAALATGGNAEVLLGGSAAMQGARDAYARGATDWQALAIGGLNGAAEAAFERLSLGNLRALKTSQQIARRTFKEILKETAIQAGVEGSEEVFTTIANTFADQLVMGDKSQLNEAIRNYMAQGMTEEEATRKAMLDWLGSTALDFAGGALSGGVMGGGVSLIGNASINAQNRRIGQDVQAKGYTEDLQAYASAMPQGNNAQQISDQLGNAKGRRAQRLTGELYRAVQQGGLQQAIETRLRELGVRDNAGPTANAILKSQNGQRLTQQETALTRTRAAQRVMSEYQGAIKGRTDMSNDWAYDAARGLREMDERALRTPEERKAAKNRAKANRKNEPAASEFSQQYGEQAEAVEAVRKMNPELDSETFERQFETAYELGRGGAQMDVAMNTTATADLTETQRQTAWEIGRAAAEATIDIMEGENENGGEIRVREGSERNDGARAAESVRGLAEGAEPAKGYPQAVARSAKDEGADSVQFRSEAVSTRQLGVREGTSRKGLYIPEESSYTTAMKEAVRVAKENGRKIVLFGGGNLEVREDGYVVSARGMYDEATNTVYVRTDHPEYTADQIARHENGHGMIADGSIDVKELQKQIAASMTEAELRQAIDDYVDLYDGTGLTEEQIIHEMICDALGNMNVFEEIDVFKEQAQRAERTMPAIRSAVQEQQKGRAPPAEADNTQKLSRETDREIVQTLGAGARVDANKDGQLIFAQSKDKHTVAFSIETLNNGGRRKLQKALEENGHTTEEIRDVLQHIEDTVTFIADLGVEYEGKGYENLRQNLYADIITDVRTHKQVLSTLVRNGDYPVNLDLALVCKKRVAYMRMISRLVQDGVLEKVTFGGDAIAKVNDILRKNGFETACLGCFVEARRLQIQNWAESIVNEWNRQVDKRVKNAPDFGFAAGKTANLSADELDAIEDEYKGAKLNEKGNKKLKQASVENKMGQLLDTTPSLLKHLRVEDLLTPAGISALRRRDGTLFSLVQQRYGAASPKIVQDFNPYNGEIADLSFKFIKDRNGEGIGGSKKYIDAAVRQLGGRPTKNKGESNAEFAKRKADFDRQAENMAMRKYLYDIGGARMQSFSDFMIENVFDYVQMFADLAAKRLPMHGYSKEIMALRLFGMTGAKWNGSLIAHAERSMGKELAGLLPAKEAANGRGIVVTDPMTGKQYAICFDDYQRHKATGSFIQSIGMKDIFALQLDPRYSSNVGSITIGVSDAQIRAMLNHPLFSMVIPYHKSGMIKEYAIRVGVDMYNDYTEYQNTRIGKVYDRNGNEVEELRVKDKVVHADTHFDFNEAVQRLGDAKAAADEYIAWCAEKHPVYSGKKVIGYETFLPKFSDSPEGYNFAYDPDTGEMRENYYKLLEDFTSYDSITGESAVQGDVRMVFPEKDGLSAQEIEAYKKRLRDTGIYTEEEINRYAQRAQMSFQDLVREAVEERLQYKKATEPNWESTVQEVEKALLSDKSARSTPEERQKKRDAKKGNEQSFSRDLSALDSDYMTAVESGDMETAQRMVDEAARKAGYTIKTYHGTTQEMQSATKGRVSGDEYKRLEKDYADKLFPFVVFRSDSFHSGIYTATDRGVAEEFSFNFNRGGTVFDLYAKAENPLVIDAKGNGWNNIPTVEAERIGLAPELLQSLRERHPKTRNKRNIYIDDIVEFAKEEDYDAVIIENVRETGTGDETSPITTDVVVFSPDQIKSADPVTYDDDGNIIPLSERFNPENADIRFSRDIESLSELRQENRELRERLERAKAQTKRTTEAAPREADVRKAARGVIKSAESKANLAEVTADMQELAAYMMNGDGRGKNHEPASWSEVKDRAVGIAETIVDNASALREGSDVGLYEDMKHYLKNTKLTLSAQDRADLGEAYGEFVRRNRKILNMGNGGIGVDVAYQEMQEVYGKGFFPEDITHPAEQLMRIADVLNGLQPIYENPHTRYYDEAVEWTANAIIDELLGEDVRQEAPTYADRAEARRVADVARERERADARVAAEREKAEKRRKAYMERSNAAVQRVREQRDRRIEQLKQSFRESKIRDRERRKENEAQRKYRARIEKSAKTLGDWLLKNSDKEHVPEPLKKVVGDFLSTLDFTSKRALRGGEATQKDARYVKRLEALQEVIANQKAFQDGSDNAQEMFGGYLDLPNGYIELLNEHLKTARNLAESGETNVINAMSAEQLRQLDEIITALTSSIRQINSLVSNGRFHSAISAAQDTIEKLRSMAEYQLGKDKLKRFLQWDNTIPFYAFRRFGEGGKAVFEGLQNGWDQFAFNVSDVLDYARDTYSDKEVREWSEKVHDFTLEDGYKVRMTTAQIMSLYKLLDRSQAVQHIEGGGIRIDNIEAGKNKIQQTDHYHFTAKDLADIVGTLTKRQREVADKLQRYMQEQGGKWGNEVSMKRFGYEAFGEEHYFPIATDDSGRPEQNPGQQGNDLYRLLNMSMTKSLNPKANNALVVQDIFNVFSDHMSDMAKYNALALPVLDMLKWYNYTERTAKDESGSFSETSLRREIVRAYGKGAREYINAFLSDLNGVNESSGRGEGWARKMISNYKVAAVAANLRVALLQPTAYVRAAYVLNPKYLAASAAISDVSLRRSAQECEKHSGIARWKGLGFYDTNISRGIREQIHDGGGVKEKIQEKAMIGAEWGDKLTWGVIWNACKLEQKAKGLSGEKLTEATAKRFREVVYATQVVDSTMTRSHAMRGKSLYSSMATAFMAEPTLSYNMLLDAYMDYDADKRKTDRSTAWRKNSGKIAKALGVYCVSAAAAAIVESLADAWRDDDEYETYLQKFLEAMFGGEPTLKGILSGNLVNNLNIFAKLPLVKDLFSRLQGFGTERIDTAAFDDLVKAGEILYEMYQLSTGKIDKPTKVTYYGNMTTYGAIYQTLKALSRLTGLPVSNLSREVTGLWNNTVGAFLPDKKLKTYDAGVKSNVKNAVENGWLSEDAAIKELVDSGAVDDENEAYWLVYGWSTGEKQYTGLLDAVRSGDAKAFQSEMDRLTSHGVEADAAVSQVKSAARQWYQGVDSDGNPTNVPKISKADAINILVQYGGMEQKEAEATVQKWTAYNVLGVSYGDIGAAYVDGDITRKQYVDARIKFGGESAEDAEAAALKLDCKIEYGFSYTENAVAQAAVDGEITKNEAKNIWMRYGGMSEYAAGQQMNKLQFVIDHPGVEFDSVSKEAIDGYNKYGEAANIPAEDFMVYVRDANSFKSQYDSDGNTTLSKKQQGVDYINSLPLTPEQKTAIYLTLWSAKTLPTWT